MANLDDRPDQDLLQIIRDSKDETNDIDEVMLMTKLISYVVRRDSKVFNHAYKLGVEKGKKGIASNTKKV